MVDLDRGTDVMAPRSLVLSLKCIVCGACSFLLLFSPHLSFFEVQAGPTDKEAHAPLNVYSRSVMV